MKKSRWFLAYTFVAVAVVAACSSDSDTTAPPATSTPDATVADTSTDTNTDTGTDTSMDTSADTSADTSVVDAGPTSYGCDLVVDGGGHTCSDFVYTNIPMNLFETSKTQCTLIKGTLKAACDRTGAVGGCTMTELKNGITTVTTTWQYAGTVADVMALCATKPGYTFVTP